jgi:hypothetical protein
VLKEVRSGIEPDLRRYQRRVRPEHLQTKPIWDLGFRIWDFQIYPSSFLPSKVDRMGVEPNAPTLQESVATMEHASPESKDEVGRMKDELAPFILHPSAFIPPK